MICEILWLISKSQFIEEVKIRGQCKISNNGFIYKLPGEIPIFHSGQGCPGLVPI